SGRDGDVLPSRFERAGGTWSIRLVGRTDGLRSARPPGRRRAAAALSGPWLPSRPAPPRAAPPRPAPRPPGGFPGRSAGAGRPATPPTGRGGTACRTGGGNRRSWLTSGGGLRVAHLPYLRRSFSHCKSTRAARVAALTPCVAVRQSLRPPHTRT